jgi:hypothetical protein
MQEVIELENGIGAGHITAIAYFSSGYCPLMLSLSLKRLIM